MPPAIEPDELLALNTVRHGGSLPLMSHMRAQYGSKRHQLSRCNGHRVVPVPPHPTTTPTPRPAPAQQNKDQEGLVKRYGGPHGLAAALGVSAKAGLNEDQVAASRGRYGANSYTAVPPKSFFAILYEGFKDPVILLLCAAATVRCSAVRYSPRPCVRERCHCCRPARCHSAHPLTPKHTHTHPMPQHTRTAVHGAGCGH
jgi:hypothetical protein